MLVKLLYDWNGDEFQEISYVRDVSENTKETIYDFIDNSEKAVFIVDCENSDPYSLCAALKNLEPSKLEKIDKIILYDDKHASAAWDILQNFIHIPIDYVMIERLKDNKSLTDIKLAARICRELFTGGVDAFLLVSSDSDYWGLIEELPEANFLIIVEHDKFSPAMKTALISKGIFYCYIDDFYTGNSQEIKQAALIRESNRILGNLLDITIEELPDQVLEATRIEMSGEEKKRFREKYLKNLEACIAEDGKISLQLHTR